VIVDGNGGSVLALQTLFDSPELPRSLDGRLCQEEMAISVYRMDFLIASREKLITKKFGVQKLDRTRGGHAQNASRSHFM
jgi:hypothetical protein